MTSSLSVLEPHLPWIREQFPGLNSPWALLDNAGGSQTLRRVADRVRDYLLETNVQLGASYPRSQEAAARVQAGVQAAAHLIGAADPREIVLGSSTTQLISNLAQAMAPGLRAGDEIILTNVDHEANVGAWTRLERFGVQIRFWQINPESQQLELEGLDALLSARTRLVCCTHTSNVLGGIQPIREIAARVHQAGAKLLVDGVAYAPHRRVDVQDLGVDYYLFSYYKVFGPHCSLLYGREELLLELSNLNHFFIAADDLPYKLQPGNLNYELTASLPGINDYLTELGGRLGAAAGQELDTAFHAIAEHEAALTGALLDVLNNHPAVRMIGPPRHQAAERVGTVSFVVEGRSSPSIVEALEEEQIAVRHGHFYATRLIRALGLEEQGGVVRASLLHYTTPQEVQQLIEALQQTIGPA